MMNKMTIVLASRNKGKVRELERLLNDLLGDVIELKSLDEVGITEEIEESGTTFEENAMIKAKAAARSGYPGLGDDSGLVVRALDMAPGVYSARYAGEHGNDGANNALLLKKLEKEENRSARFVCAIGVATPAGERFTVRGETEGVILNAPRGEGGFGYDPLFFYEPMGKTFSEMSGEEKNSISHRGKAIERLAEELKKRNLEVNEVMTI